MGRFETIKTTINAEIRDNGKKEITGNVMNGVLNGVVDSVDSVIEEVESNIREDMVSIEALTDGLAEKVDKEEGKGLSTNDFTTAEKEKLQSLENYDDSAILNAIESLGKEDEALSADIATKQDIITDLATIRSGASKGATALQSVPAEYVTETELTNKGYATTSALNSGLNSKVDKVAGKGLSTEDFTTALKTKLQGLSNYDDSAVNAAIAGLQSQIDTLTSGDASSAIESFNEIIAFLEGIEDSEDLSSIIASIEQQIASVQSSIPTKVSQLTNDKGYLTEHQDISSLATKTELSEGLATKQDIITDLATIRSGAAKGATALQEIPAEYVTETELTAKGYATQTELSDGLAEKQDIITDLATIRSGASKGATALQSVPAEYVTETELTDKGYAVASDVTNSLAGKVDKVTGKGLSTNDYTTAEKTKLAGIAAGAEVNVQSDWNATSGDAAILNKPSLAAVATSGSYSDLSDTPTIPTIPSSLKNPEALTFGSKSYDGSVAKEIAETDIVSDIATIRSGAAKGATALQSVPSEYVTETELSDGLAEKQDTIADLDTIRAGAAKGATALQSYTEQYKGTITGVSANGTSVATSGVANIPAASTSAYGVTKLSSAVTSTSTALAATASAVKAAYDLANGKQDAISDLATIRSGAAKGATAVQDENYPVVTIGTSTTSQAMQPNTYYKRASSSSALTLTFATPSDSTIVNEYVVEIVCGGSFSLTLPSSVVWANDTAPEIESGKTIIISVVNNLAIFAEFAS